MMVRDRIARDGDPLNGTKIDGTQFGDGRGKRTVEMADVSARSAPKYGARTKRWPIKREGGSRVKSIGISESAHRDK